jgi:aminoglycoside phosphotransferase (APT) family kinase protein
MESITKNRQTPATLRAMVARAYGAEQVPTGEPDTWLEELGHGWFNVAYRILLRDGRAVVVKIAPPRDVPVLTAERGAMRIELDALALITARTDVPVPQVDHADLTHELVDADYFFMPYVDAENFGIVTESLSAEQRDAYDEALGAANRELNSIRGSRFGPLAGPGDLSWRTAFTGRGEDTLADGEARGVDIGRDYDEIGKVVALHADVLDDVTEPRFVEWDLWDSNVMVRDGAIVTIIDHERALYGDPLMEAGFAALDLPDLGDSTAFMRGYGREDLTPREQTRRRLYSLHLVVIMAIETVYRGHTTPTQYDWAREKIDTMMRLLTEP